MLESGFRMVASTGPVQLKLVFGGTWAFSCRLLSLHPSVSAMPASISGGMVSMPTVTTKLFSQPVSSLITVNWYCPGRFTRVSVCPRAQAAVISSPFPSNGHQLVEKFPPVGGELVRRISEILQVRTVSGNASISGTSSLMVTRTVSCAEQPLDKSVTSRV